MDFFPFFRTWVDRFNVIIASVVYSFLRVLEDHQQPQFAALRQKEVNLVISLLRERFSVSIFDQINPLWTDFFFVVFRDIT